MDPLLNIPNKRRTMPLWRMCLIMGLTAIVLLLLHRKLDAVVAMFAGPSLV